MLTIIDDKNMGFSLGAAEYLTKPVDRERLIRVIRRFNRDGKGGRALVVDDDVAARDRMRELLRGESWEVIEAGNGVEGLAALGGGMPDLILLDLMMPDMPGSDLHRWLLEFDPKLARRFVFITGGAFTARTSGYTATLSNPTIEKPFDPPQLVSLVSRLVAAARCEGT